MMTPPCRSHENLIISVSIILISACSAPAPAGPDPEGLRRLEEELGQVDADSAPDRKAAAEHYLQVAAERQKAAPVRSGGESPEYLKALLKAGHCYRQFAAESWADPRAKKDKERDVQQALRLAEEAFQQVLAVLDDPARRRATDDPLPMESHLSWMATLELATLYAHEASPRPGECLDLLEKAAPGLQAGDARLAKVWALKIHVQVSQREVYPAVQTLDLMLDRFPDAPEAARASKTVAILLDEATEKLVQEKAEESRITDNLRRVSRYYLKWILSAPGQNMRVTTADVLTVAETLYANAKRLSGLDENVISFLDLKGRQVKEAQCFRDAATVHTMLTDGSGKLSDRERIALMTRIARCYSFIARDAEGWRKARDHYENILRFYKAVTPSGNLDGAVLQAHRSLLGVYLEEGYVCFELGKDGPLEELGNAAHILGNILGIVKGAPESLWTAEYEALKKLVESGLPEHLKLARTGMENLERENPDFDGGRYGMKPKFLELKEKLR